MLSLIINLWLTIYLKVIAAMEARSVRVRSNRKWIGADIAYFGDSIS